MILVEEYCGNQVYIATLCRSSNFKPTFDNAIVRSTKIYVGESCRELNSLSNGS